MKRKNYLYYDNINRWIRNLKNQVIEMKVGVNYLVQHTTGSGKSYSIGWLSFMLTNLFKNDGQDGLFDSKSLLQIERYLINNYKILLRVLKKLKVLFNK